MMDLSLVFDPLFRIPLAVGLLFAAVLPVIGVYLRMRDEWLAALGYTHVAAAGALASGLLHWPILLCALLAAGLAAAIKAMFRRPGNDLYAAMTVAGWAIGVLLAANSHHGEVLGQTLLRGQLYFAGLPLLWAALAIVAATAALMPWLGRRLLKKRFFPDHHPANGIPQWPHESVFALLVVGALVFATTALGAMSAFALVFIPAWVAFRLCSSWRVTIVTAAGLGILAYAVAFVAAIALDQPLGPVLVVTLLALAPLRLWGRVL